MARSRSARLRIQHVPRHLSTSFYRKNFLHGKKGHLGLAEIIYTISKRCFYADDFKNRTLNPTPGIPRSKEVRSPCSRWRVSAGARSSTTGELSARRVADGPKHEGGPDKRCASTARTANFAFDTSSDALLSAFRRDRTLYWHERRLVTTGNARVYGCSEWQASELCLTCLDDEGKRSTIEGWAPSSIAPYASGLRRLRRRPVAIVELQGRLRFPGVGVLKRKTMRV